MKRSAFTLIEILIVAAVFALTVLLATTVFTNVQVTQRGIQARQRVVADGRYVMETLARSVRSSTINYLFYGQQLSGGGVDTLVLSDQVGTITCYRKFNNTVQVISPATVRLISGFLQCSTKNGSDWASITPTDLNIDQLVFYISPLSDPNKSVPTATSECKVTTPVKDTSPPNFYIHGYDPDIGACTCTPASASSDCYSDQTCIAGRSVSGVTQYICANANIQPQVTIYLKTSSTNTAAGEQASSTLQTTVASRLYLR